MCITGDAHLLLHRYQAQKQFSSLVQPFTVVEGQQFFVPIERVYATVYR